MWRAFVCLWTGLSAALALAAETSKATEAKEPDKDPKVSSLLTDARKWLDAREAAAAVGVCEKVDEIYRAFYAARPEKIYCARTHPETLALLLAASNRREKAIVIGPNWGAARFMKAYALVELRRAEEARRAIQAALELSPMNAQYLCELGAIEVSFKNWKAAQVAYQGAADHAGLVPEEKKGDLARARRGLGYVLVELGDLDGAAKIYELCLQDDPKDERARRELEFVRNRQKK